MESPKMYDLIIQNGHVIDPSNNLDAPMDVAIKDGKIAAVALGIDSAFGEKYVDVAHSYVIPGIIDIHTHVYPILPRDKHALPAIDCDSHMLRAGVTTTADAGTVGWRDFLTFKEQVIDRTKVRVLAYLNIASKGMVDMRSEQTPADMHPEIAAEVAKTYADVIVGIKAAHYWGSPWKFDADHPAWASVDNALKASDLSGMPVMIDFQPNLPDSSYPDLITKRLRPGDIHTHVFARQFPTVDKNGRVYEHMRAAREKGIYFDLGHGAGSFWFRNGVRALRDGFPPDTLSTDLHMGSVGGAALTMLHVMAKFHNMGMPLQEVVMRSTCMPAKLIRRPDLGTLSVGSCADVAVFRRIDGKFDYVDNGGARLVGHSMFDCQMTICAGNIAYNAYGIGLPLWEEAPEDYWKVPFEL